MTKLYYILLLLTTTSLSAQTVQIDVNHTVKRYLGDVSELDRSKYFNLHGNGNDADYNEFFNTYDVGKGRQFWGPFSWATNQTGEVGDYPDEKAGGVEVRYVTRFISTEHPASAFKDDIDVDKAGAWAAEYWKDFVNDDGRPEYFEVMNEPFVKTQQFYDGGWNGAKHSELVTEMSELYAAVGKAIQEEPALANMKVIGYSSAWPSLELNNFSHWEEYQKQFMDIAGEHMDAFATHLYDGINVSGQDNKRSGSNSEAILDLIETYSYVKWGLVKPHAISEYGGIEQGFGDGYSDLRNSQSLVSINHILFNLLDREENMEISIPFITDKSTWHINENNNYQPYTPSLFIPTNIGEPNPAGWRYSPRIHFYDLWQGVEGHRVHILSDNPDIQHVAYVNGSELYVALSNLDEHNRDVRLNLWAGTDLLEEVEMRALRVYGDKVPEYEVSNSATAPGTFTLIPNEVVVLRYKFTEDITVEHEVVQKKYYSERHIVPIKTFATESFEFSGVEAVNGYATIRMSLSRKHNRSKEPIVKVNDTEIPVPTNWKGYDQANRDDFFGMIEIPVPMDLLQQDNKVDIRFGDDGGFISSVILSVNNSEFAVSNKEITDSSEDLSFFPNPARDQLTMDLGVPVSDSRVIEVMNHLGQRVVLESVAGHQTTHRLNISSLANGIYVMIVGDENGKRSGKFVKVD